MSFPLGTPLTVHRLPTDTHRAAWAVYKADTYDLGRGCAYPGVLHEVLASSLCISQNSRIHLFVSCRQHSSIHSFKRALLRNCRNIRGVDEEAPVDIK